MRRKAANGDLADARAWLDGCGADAELVALTVACLSAEPVDRPRDAQAVADGLTAYLDGVQERWRKAELAEAEAKAKATEETKRRQDSDLAGLRDKAALAKLPAEERAACTKLWADVAALLKKADSPSPKDPKQ